MTIHTLKWKLETPITLQSSQTNLQVPLISKKCEKKAKNQVHCIQKSNKQQQRFMLATIHENSKEKMWHKWDRQRLRIANEPKILLLFFSFTFFSLWSFQKLVFHFKIDLWYQIVLLFLFVVFLTLCFLGALSSPYSYLFI